MKLRLLTLAIFSFGINLAIGTDQPTTLSDFYSCNDFSCSSARNSCSLTNFDDADRDKGCLALALSCGAGNSSSCNSLTSTCSEAKSNLNDHTACLYIGNAYNATIYAKKGSNSNIIKTYLDLLEQNCYTANRQNGNVPAECTQLAIAIENIEPNHQISIANSLSLFLTELQSQYAPSSGANAASNLKQAWYAFKKAVIAGNVPSKNTGKGS